MHGENIKELMLKLYESSRNVFGELKRPGEEVYFSDLVKFAKFEAILFLTYLMWFISERNSSYKH